MAYLKTLFLTGGPQFSSQIWKASCKALGTTASLSSRYHSKTNGQTVRANQDLESALRCVTAHHPSSWSANLPWIECAHNSLVCSTTGMSPFMAAQGFQPPVPIQAEEITVPSVQDTFRRCCHVCKAARAALCCMSRQNQSLADQHRIPGPSYQLEQQVWLSSHNIPLQDTRVP